MEGKAIDSLKDLYSSFPAVKIENGVFKYIFIRVTNPATNETVLFLRGSADFEYHAQIFEDFEAKFLNHLKVRGVKLTGSEHKLVDQVHLKCPGGGRIEHLGNLCSVKSHYKMFSQR